VTTATIDRPAPGGLSRLWNRQLDHYPDTGPRTTYLAITVLATIVLYYELYVQGAVSTKIIGELHFSFTQFVFVAVIGNAVGAFASLFAGLADRWGRANLVVAGVLITGLLILFGIPHAHNRTTYTVLLALVSLVEGIALVATPALIRDFSPQVGRGQAMGFWTLGPVLGSLVVTEVSSHTLSAHPDWRYQFYICGIAGLVVALIALVGLRELSPRLRDQLMVSMRDRALVEARAQGIDPERALQGHWRQMLRFDIVGSAFAVSVFLLLYYILVGFLVVYFATTFGYSEQKANSLANWYWITNAIALVIAGVLSDKVRVRKPFMVIGTLISMVGTILFALATTHPHTSYYSFVVYFILSSAGGGMAYVAWMAAFTETVEKHNPAATATGLAVWGWVLRLVVTAAFALLTVIVPATTALVDNGPRVQEIVAKYPTQVKVLQTVDPATLAALQANANNQSAQVKALTELSGLPATDVVRVVTLGAQLKAGAKLAPGDLAFLGTNGPKVQAAATSLQSVAQVPPADLAYLGAHGSKVAQAQKDNPKQWQHWWWICLAGQLVFLPFVFVLAGRWSPRRAREDELAHERLVEQELARLRGGDALSSGITRPAPDEPRTRTEPT